MTALSVFLTKNNKLSKNLCTFLHFFANFLPKPNVIQVRNQTFFLPPTPTLTIVNLRYKNYKSPLCILYKKEPNSVKYRSKSEPRTDLHRVWLFGSTEDYLTYLFASFRFAIASLRSAIVTRPYGSNFC